MAAVFWDSEDSDDGINISMVPGLRQTSPVPVPVSAPAPIPMPEKTELADSPIPALLNMSISSPKAYNSIDLDFGQVSREGMYFAPFKLLQQYPYLFVGKANQELVRILYILFTIDIH